MIRILLKGISKQATNICILVFCKDQKALVLPITKKSYNEAKLYTLSFSFYLEDLGE